MKIASDIAIARPPEQVWAILGDLAGVTRWVPGISSVRMEGMRRICVLEDGGKIHEEISDFSDEKRRYRYEQTVHPLGFRRSEGTLAVTANGVGSAVAWNAEVVFADRTQQEQIVPMLKEGYAAALANLKDVVERS
jgi:uncharacterized protein YndB with AHSA1/START domain